jgi:hypothetical protein
MYLIDRLSLLASLWKQEDHTYNTKASTVEWILHEKDVKMYSNLDYTSPLSNSLDQITMFLKHCLKNTLWATWLRKDIDGLEMLKRMNTIL